MLFKEGLHNIEAEEQGTAVLQCEISKPDAPVEWRKGGLLLHPSDKYEMRQNGTNVELIIHDLKPEDCGPYTCSTGYEMITGSVYVQGKNKLFQMISHFWLNSIRCFFGQQARFSAGVSRCNSTNFFLDFNNVAHFYAKPEFGPIFII